jgi:hypothetical protein
MVETARIYWSLGKYFRKFENHHLLSAMMSPSKTQKNRPLCLKIYGGLGPGLRRGDELFLSFLFDPKHDVSFCAYSMSKSKTIKQEKS